MNEYIYLAITSIFLILILRWFLILIRKRFINKYSFPDSVVINIKKAYPQLSDAEIDMISKALKDYFYISYIVGNFHISMPSKIVSDFWQEFSSLNKEYKSFCKKAFGKNLEWLKAEGIEGIGIQTIWENACILEDIDHIIPDKLPILFKLDSLLEIENGFLYTLDCRKLDKQKNEYCAAKIMNSKFYGEIESGYAHIHREVYL